MTRFTFRLATLLRLRESDRDQRRAELAQAYHADDILRQQHEELERERLGLVAGSREAAGPGTVDVDRLIQTQRYELLLRSHQQQLGRQREAVAAEIGRRRETLVRANREVRILENLREKQVQRHYEEEGRREVKRLDEVAAQRVGREETP
jgi:flagellar export protein FliJ